MRKAHIKRKTAETDISLKLDLGGSGKTSIKTGIGFLDHLFDALARHSRFDLELTCSGDLEVDDHHTAEDCAICLGQAIDEALGERKGIRRFGSAYAPLDESLARAVVDLSGRAFADVNIGLNYEKIGELSMENVPHVIESLAVNAKACIHVDIIRGKNDHHKAEAAYKALALALREAVSTDGSDGVPSTKEML